MLLAKLSCQTATELPSELAESAMCERGLAPEPVFTGNSCGPAPELSSTRTQTAGAIGGPVGPCQPTCQPPVRLIATTAGCSWSPPTTVWFSRTTLPGGLVGKVEG